MPKSYNQKMKLLCLMDILNEKTDEGHSLSMKEILSMLEAAGVKAARKSIYSDMDTLRQAGMDIEYRKEPSEGYYLSSRPFEIAELKLLVDLVQSSRFITQKKSRSLIKKIEGLASRYQASALQRQVYVSDRIKTMNESIYYNVDKLHASISGNRIIRFQYAYWSPDKKLELRNGGQYYTVSPWILSWAEENYYLIAYDELQDILKHFRVDKMLKIEIIEEKRKGEQYFKDFEPAKYSRKTFGMFAGEEQTLLIKFPNRLVGTVIDRFGKEVVLRKEGESHFSSKIDVAVSEQFFGWLTGLGKGVLIMSPEREAKRYQKFLMGIIELYE